MDKNQILCNDNHVLHGVDVFFSVRYSIKEEDFGIVFLSSLSVLIE